MILFQMSNAGYHEQPAISKSGLDRINQSPAHYQSWLSEPRQETPALIFGSAAHCQVLEPESFWDRYIESPDGIDRRTSAGKLAWAAFEKTAAGKIPLKKDDVERLQKIATSINTHPSAAELLQDGIAEASCFAEIWGVDVKCRPDWLRDDGIVVDLKTTDDASPDAFSRSVAKYRYHVQAAFYSDILAIRGRPVSAFIFIAVEKTPPYAVSVFELDPSSLEAGRDAYQRNLDTYKRCVETGQWPAYSNAIETLSLPRWAFAEAA